MRTTVEHDGSWRSRATLGTSRAVARGLRRVRHRGLYHVVRAVRGLLDGPSRVVARLDEDVAYEFALGDPYWNRLLDPEYRYEPELQHVLNRLKHMRYTLVDCGANHGWWSCQVTGQALGAQRAIAVEPVSDNVARLERNRALNGGRFEIVDRALSDQDDLELDLFVGHGHAGGSLLDEGLGTAQRVRTVTLDTLLADVDGELVIKLDVEGVEVQALNGATEVLSRKPLLLYEDHAKDVDCTISRHVLEQLGWTVLFMHDDGGLHSMPTVDAVRAVKVDPRRGYNFIGLAPGAAFHELLPPDESAGPRPW